MSQVSAFAPGRVELLGNHTDYNAGVVLSAALQLGVTATGGLRNDGRFVLNSPQIGEAVSGSAALVPEATHSWADYPLGVVEMLRKGGLDLQGGFEITFSSTLPSGAGLSSSAAIEVATAEFFLRALKVDMDPFDVARLCRRAENEFVGVNCGLLDQVSSMFGRREHAIFLDCRAETVDTIPLPAHIGMLVIHSGVKHALTGGEYNERRSQCFEAARLLGVPALRDARNEELERCPMPDVVRRRARHIVGENERVFEALQCLRAGDAEAFGRLMTASHRSSMENFENSTPELDVLVELAIAQPGCHGARLTGGGFGGAIVALVDSEAAGRVGEQVIAGYRQRCGHEAAAYSCRAGDGAFALRREVLDFADA